MCGYLITTEPAGNPLTHRGVSFKKSWVAGYHVVFNSLPLCTYGTGLEQPLHTSRYTILFNGEIFNYKKLDPEATSDLGYLANLAEDMDFLALYHESVKWDGFWALTLIEPNGDISLFTDPLGKKQLYYNATEICSEIRPLLGRVSRYQVYDERAFLTPSTNFSDVFRARPGLLYRSQGNSWLTVWAHQYYPGLSFPGPTIRRSPTLMDAIRESVHSRLENKYDGISLFLSGGLDSNIVLHHVLEVTRNVEVLSLANSGEKDNILRACDHHKVEPRFLSEEYTTKDLVRAVTHYEHSLDYGSLISNYLLFRGATHSLVLTGDGADELFSGYKRALERDTWEYDVFQELPYYHNIRLDRMSMMFTKEARSPLMSYYMLQESRKLPWSERRGKKVLRETYKGILPDFITQGVKVPLRHGGDKQKNRTLIREIHQTLFQ